ncbi:MAG: TldD/PmbA family protein [Candidatus Heimdallarchaeota archaeon]
MLEVLAEEAMKNAEAIGLDAIEVFLQKKELKRVEIRKGAIKNITTQERSGIALRAIVNNQMSFVSSNAPRHIKEIVELSAQNARASSQRVRVNFVDKKYITPVSDIRDLRLIDLTLDEITEGISEMLSSIEKSKPVKNLDGEALIEIEERLVANSEGLWKRERGSRMKAYIMTTIQVGDFIGMGSDHFASRTLVEDWQPLFNSSIKTALNQQNRKKMTLGRPKGIILSSDAAAQILAFTIIPSFNHTSSSQYHESFSNCRFNSNLQFVDDPTFTGAQNTFGFDDEGYPSRPRIVVSGGKCKRLLGMNFSCHDIDRKDIYLGNCYRVTSLNLDTRSYVYAPTVSSSNFIVKARKKASGNLLANLDNGIYVKQVTGAQDANYYTGDFVVSVLEGYEVKNGEIANPILPCYITGNIYRILEEQALMLGNQLREITIPGTPINVILPELLTSRMTISV